ncbi:MAG: metallophosphoesterase [Clostridia bacterium]|nr:metallophosphoesterase [Clostridia bacterium]
MQSVKNNARIFVSKALSSYYSLITSFGKSTEAFPKAPADFRPVLRFAACSDIHVSGKESTAEERHPEEERLAKLINFMYDYSAKQEYKGFDALCIAGDMTDGGRDFEYDSFNKVIKENLKDETKFLICTGNHEYIAYRDKDASEGARMFEEKIQPNQDTHEVINGYHFVLCSYSEDGRTFKAKLPWFDKEIASAVKESGKKPVFTFQHPAPQRTIYGSVCWGDKDIPKVFRKYPQMINFSGHSHYPVNDLRSIWQNKYTALGCGTLSYYETDLDGFAGNFPYEFHEAAQFYIVEADAQGNVRILSYDLITDRFFDNEYYLTGLADKNYAYKFAKMKRSGGKPVFPQNTEISTRMNEHLDTILTFTGAEDKYCAESYKVSVFAGLKSVHSSSFSGKYMYLFEDNKYEINIGKLKPGKYTAYIKAMNPYAKTSKELKYKFEV